MLITEKPFGHFEGNNVTEYTLRNAAGMQVMVINYGAAITKIITADKNNSFATVTRGYNDLDGYLGKDNPYFGCIAGRYCNRIANGKFSLDGKAYQLAKNDGNNHLHGGIKGFDKVWWKIEKQEDQNRLLLHYFSKDNEEGYPGNVNVEVVYTLTEGNALTIDYIASTDKPCPVNLTNHSYFNLTGKENTDILDHELELSADQYTMVDQELIPTGKLAMVKNTGFDFNKSKKIGKDIQLTNGYDHNFVLNGKIHRNEYDFSKAASLYDPFSGRYMELFTSEPGLQFYTGKFLNTETNKKEFAALCLEAQHYPNSPNEPSFPNTILRPGEVYRQTTVYKFSVK